MKSNFWGNNCDFYSIRKKLGTNTVFVFEKKSERILYSYSKKIRNEYCIRIRSVFDRSVSIRIQNITVYVTCF